MADIFTKTGQRIIVDDADFDVLSKYTWRINKGGYAFRSSAGRNIFLHAVILPTCPPGMMRDHRNRNRLDNRRKNLRLATPLESQGNTGIRKDNRSGFKGVTWNKEASRWKAQIRGDGKRLFLGYFHDAVEAARAYDRKARELFGEFAFLNFAD